MALNKVVDLVAILNQIQTKNTKVVIIEKINTCSGVSANFLPPMEKATSGMDASLLQSTDDSPIGLGI